MRIKWYVFSLLVFVLTIFCFNSELPASADNKTLFDDIVAKTGSSIMEYGITTSFRTPKDGSSVCKEILNEMSLSNDIKVNAFKSDTLYRLNFKGKNISGFVESVPDDGTDIIKLYVLESENSDGLSKLKSMVKKAVGNYYKDPILFLYLKAKCPEFDIEDTNRTIVSLLKDSGTIDIDTVKLNKGVSNVCYTGRFEPTVINGKLIDFNFAVAGYSSGNYIIMGTPEILETY